MASRGAVGRGEAAKDTGVWNKDGKEREEYGTGAHWPPLVLTPTPTCSENFPSTFLPVADDSILIPVELPILFEFWPPAFLDFGQFILVFWFHLLFQSPAFMVIVVLFFKPISIVMLITHSSSRIAKPEMNDKLL